VAEKQADRTSDCCRLTRYGFLDERDIANALTEPEYYPKVGQCPEIANCGSPRHARADVSALTRYLTRIPSACVPDISPEIVGLFQENWVRAL